MFWECICRGIDEGGDRSQRESGLWTEDKPISLLVPYEQGTVICSASCNKLYQHNMGKLIDFWSRPLVS